MSKRKVTFKSYSQNQQHLFPLNVEDLIPSNHAVRKVNDIIDQIDLSNLLNEYQGGGCSAYHPRMLLKVVIFAYLSNIYSSRQIEESLKSNIYFMWLSGHQRPDHNTINRFRSERLPNVLKTVFVAVVKMLAQSGIVSLNQVYVDGTKLEANANKYTFVWRKNVERYKGNIEKRLETLWTYTQQVAASELQANQPVDFDNLTPKKIQQTVKEINTALKKKVLPKKIKNSLKTALKTDASNYAKYQQQLATLGNRNSYSKTDPDATFMRMKDDHMKNGQLKAGYNWQVTSSNQYIVNYDIFCNPNDTLTFLPHIKDYHQCYGHYPTTICADAGYGSEENYEFLSQASVTAYVKYNTFHKQQRQAGKADKKKPFVLDYLHYNQQEDYVVCPMGQRMEKVGQTSRKTASGYQQKISLYRAKNCLNCPLRSVCHKSKENRTVQINHNLKAHRTKAKRLLLSQEGKRHRSQRPVDVEPIFGNIKQNKHFTRMNLRGKGKVLIEIGLLSIAHNLKKWAA